MKIWRLSFFLAGVIKTSSIFEQKNTSGTLISYFTPNYLGTISIPIFHFISDQASLGGHVLNVTINSDIVFFDQLDLIQLHVFESNTASDMR